MKALRELADALEELEVDSPWVLTGAAQTASAAGPQASALLVFQIWRRARFRVAVACSTAPTSDSTWSWRTQSHRRKLACSQANGRLSRQACGEGGCQAPGQDSGKWTRSHKLRTSGRLTSQIVRCRPWSCEWPFAGRGCPDGGYESGHHRSGG